MPSDSRLTHALAALARPIAEFRAIIEGALVQTDAFLAAQHASDAQHRDVAAASLGEFAAGRMDASAFGALVPILAPAAPDALAAIEHARSVLSAVRDAGDAFFMVDVPPGRRLAFALESALAEASRAFGAVVLSEAVRAGRYTPELARLLEPHEFRSWKTVERRFAPPLVVEVDGADLQASALLDFADGHEKIIIVVRGQAPPAPLARCITPGTFVLQTTDGSGLDRVAAFDGPAVAAVLPEGAAVFMHDPAAGKEPWQRVTVKHIPASPKKAIGGQSTWQMSEDLRVVTDLATTPFVVPEGDSAPTPAVGAADATDRLAAWLIGQVNLDGGAA